MSAKGSSGRASATVPAWPMTVMSGSRMQHEGQGLPEREVVVDQHHPDRRADRLLLRRPSCSATTIPPPSCDLSVCSGGHGRAST